jgi:D-glycero-D-manno-heptose 1,7-bisphosphate phosphatase
VKLRSIAKPFREFRVKLKRVSGTAYSGRRAVFLDRDGVLNESVVRDGKPYPPATPADLRIIPGTREALARLKEQGFLLIVVTNQPDVSRGTQSESAVQEMHQSLRRELPLDDVWTCFHDDSDQCDCRKPRPGMLTRSAAQYGIDLQQSYMIGDRWRDVDAGANAGCSTIWIDRGYSERPPSAPPDVRVQSLREAVDWIAGRANTTAAKRPLELRPVRRIALSLFIALFLIYLSLSPGTVWGSGYTGEEIESGLRMMSIVTAVSKGRPIPPMLWSRHGPTPILFDLPFLKVGKVFATPDRALSFAPILFTAGLMTIVFLWLQKICARPTALVLTLAGAFGTMIWPYAYIGLETKQSFFVLLCGYLGLARGKIRGWPRLVLFAVLCAFALTVKATGVIMWPAIAYLFYVQFRDDWKQRWRQLLTLSAIVIAFCAINVVLRNFYWNPQGGSASLLKGWVIQSAFQIFTNVVGLFGSPAKGLFIFAPILILIVWAIPKAFRANRDLAVFASLVLICTIGFLSILNYTTDETWGSRYLHVTIAPLIVCIGAAWPRLTWRVHLPFVVLALVGVVISFLGAFFYYGARGSASHDARLNTMEWLTSDNVWNEVTFSALLFQVWWQGGSNPVPWTPNHLWVWTPPADVPAWQSIDLRKYAEPQSMLFYYWRRPDVDPVQRSWLRLYFASLPLGLLMLARTVVISAGPFTRKRLAGNVAPRRKSIYAIAGFAVIAGAAVWIALPANTVPKLTLDKTEVVGDGHYALSVPRMPGEIILVRYSLNQAEPEEMMVRLDAQGVVHFDVGRETPKGVYRFDAFKRKDDLFWFKTDVAITVK